MAGKKVTVLNYGSGNTFSVCRAFESLGADVELTSSLDKIKTSERLILPGVGAFSKAMSLLNEGGFIDQLKEYSSYERPFLGICLGMQVMCDLSLEFGETQGLGIIPGKVMSIPAKSSTGESLKIPHIGWNTISVSELNDSTSRFFNGVKDTDSVYFVHSFEAITKKEENTIATTEYGGNHLTAAIQQGWMFGCQFHPERSGKVGLKILDNFLSF